MVFVCSLGLQFGKIMIKYTCSASVPLACLLRMSAVSLVVGRKTRPLVCAYMCFQTQVHPWRLGLDMRGFLLLLARLVLEKSQALADHSACSGLPPASGFGLLSN